MDWDWLRSYASNSKWTLFISETNCIQHPQTSQTLYEISSLIQGSSEDHRQMSMSWWFTFVEWSFECWRPCANGDTLRFCQPIGYVLWLLFCWCDPHLANFRNLCVKDYVSSSLLIQYICPLVHVFGTVYKRSWSSFLSSVTSLTLYNINISLLPSSRIIQHQQQRRRSYGIKVNEKGK